MAQVKSMEAALTSEKGALATPSLNSVAPPPYDLPVFTISRIHGKHWKVFQGEGKNGPGVYFAAAHHWSKKPSLVLHQGDSADGARLGFGRVDCSGGGARVALGDPEQASKGVTYDFVTETSCWSMKAYEVQTNTHYGGHASSNHAWTRKSCMGSSFDCKDVSTGEVLATYKSHGVFKPGTFKLEVPPPNEAFLLQMLLGFLAVREMEWRRSATIAAVAS